MSDVQVLQLTDATETMAVAARSAGVARTQTGVSRLAVSWYRLCETVLHGPVGPRDTAANRLDMALQ